MSHHIYEQFLLSNFDQNLPYIVYDTDWNIISISQYLLELLELSQEQCLNKNRSDFFLSTNTNNQIEYKSSTESFWFKVQTIPLYENDQIIGYHEIYTNITYKKQLENELYKDKLTNLKNYKALNSILESKNYLFPVLILINIDNFKNINNLYGFEVGNELLNQFAHLLVNFKSNTKYEIYRLYADEFAFFIDGDFMDIDQYYEDLETIKSLVRSQQFYIESIDDVISINITIGVSIGQEEPLSTVDLALRYAKRNNLWLQAYNTTLDITEEVKYSHEMKKKIELAIKQNKLFAVYQPIVNKQKEIVKYEVLVRMKTLDENGDEIVVSPVKFLDESIRNKQYNQIIKIILQQAFKDHSQSDKMISINLSFDDIYNDTLVETILDLTDQYPQMASRLIIELLETSSIYNLEVMQNFLYKMRQRSIKIAIDDFGMGHSNLSHLLIFKPDFLKIDAQFVKNIDVSKEAIALVKAIVSICHELDIIVIAEHVHSKEVFEVLDNLDVDQFQGFYFYEPSEKIIN